MFIVKNLLTTVINDDKILKTSSIRQSLHRKAGESYYGHSGEQAGNHEESMQITWNVSAYIVLALYTDIACGIDVLGDQRPVCPRNGIYCGAIWK